MEKMPFVKCKRCGQIFHSVPILEQHFRDTHAPTDEDTDELGGMISILGAEIIENIIDQPPSDIPTQDPAPPPDDFSGDGGTFGGGGATDSF